MNQKPESSPPIAYFELNPTFFHLLFIRQASVVTNGILSEAGHEVLANVFPTISVKSLDFQALDPDFAVADVISAYTCAQEPTEGKTLLLITNIDQAQLRTISSLNDAFFVVFYCHSDFDELTANPALDNLVFHDCPTNQYTNTSFPPYLAWEEEMYDYYLLNGFYATADHLQAFVNLAHEFYLHLMDLDLSSVTLAEQESFFTNQSKTEKFALLNYVENTFGCRPELLLPLKEELSTRIEDSIMESNAESDLEADIESEGFIESEVDVESEEDVDSERLQQKTVLLSSIIESIFEERDKLEQELGELKEFAQKAKGLDRQLPRVTKVEIENTDQIPEVKQISENTTKQEVEMSQERIPNPEISETPVAAFSHEDEIEKTQEIEYEMIECLSPIDEDVLEALSHLNLPEEVMCETENNSHELYAEALSETHANVLLTQAQKTPKSQSRSRKPEKKSKQVLRSKSSPKKPQTTTNSIPEPQPSKGAVSRLSPQSRVKSNLRPNLSDRSAFKRWIDQCFENLELFLNS